MKPFEALLELFALIEDPRRAEGKMYRLPHVILFSLLAVLSGANSLRTLEAFMDVHLKQLRRHFGLRWKRAPAHTTIRSILVQLDPADVERVFRRHAAGLMDGAPGRDLQEDLHADLHVAIDGKTLRGSFDHFEDRKAAHVLGAFASGLALMLAHRDCGEKSNEIPAVRALLAELGLPPGALVTVDAMHCQKNLRGGGCRRPPPDRPVEGQPAEPARGRHPPWRAQHALRQAADPR